METLRPHTFTNDWKRKLIALLGAIAVWLFVNQTITATKTVSNVPIRVINLPQDKTIQGLLPNGILNRRATLTLTGTKDVVDTVESSELEVVIDAANQPDEWILQVNKKNLVSLNPEVDLLRHIQSVSNNEFVVKMSRLVTRTVPIIIQPPMGAAPEGYQFLDIWPQNLTQTVTGPYEQVEQLEDRGFQMTFDLGRITKAQLDEIKGSSQTFRDDEVNFTIPDSWKTVIVPFESDLPQTINDPRAIDLQISFLRKELIPIPNELPIRVFYPVEFSKTLNPTSHPLMPSNLIHPMNGIQLLTRDLWANGVSRLFVDIIRDSVEIVVIAAPESEREFLQWSLEFINQRELEDTFVALLMTDHSAYVDSADRSQKHESRLRRRFREYVREFTLYSSSTDRLSLEAKIDSNGINVSDISSVP